LISSRKSYGKIVLADYASKDAHFCPMLIG
jgi:hypothetical protein